MSELQGIYLNTNKPLRNKFGVREKTLLSIALFVFLLGSIMIMGSLISADDISINLTNKNLEPSLNHLFGTDWVGRDMFYRTIKGLSLSMKVGFLASFISGTIALTLGVIGATLGKTVDNIITWIIDLILSVPHALIVILISISVGGGFKGIVLGVSLTHWPSLTRVIRAEIMQIRESDYVKISKKFGKSNLYIAIEHIIPHIIPQLLIGIVLIFPHAVLGLPPHEPAIGIILSESMKYLNSGRWWLVFFPGVSLVMVSLMVDNIGKQVNKLINPKTAYK